MRGNQEVLEFEVKGALLCRQNSTEAKFELDMRIVICTHQFKMSMYDGYNERKLKTTRIFLRCKSNFDLELHILMTLLYTVLHLTMSICEGYNELKPRFD